MLDLSQLLFYQWKTGVFGFLQDENLVTGY